MQSLKQDQRLEALRLRRHNLTYQDILCRLPVAKSTLWRWLKAEGLVETQPQRLTELRRLAQQKGAAVVRQKRIRRTELLIEEGKQEIGLLTSRDLLILGIALYWAEGAKQKEYNTQVSERVVFSNTDPRMLQLFVTFLKECCGVLPSTLSFRIYLHETADATAARTYWSHHMGLEVIHTAPITWKRHRPTIFRRNIGNTYHGLLRIVVPKSSDLNRRINGWIHGMCIAVGE